MVTKYAYRLDREDGDGGSIHVSVDGRTVLRVEPYEPRRGKAGGLDPGDRDLIRAAIERALESVTGAKVRAGDEEAT